MKRNFKYIEPTIMREIELNHISGANICVLKDGKEIYKSSFGYADREEKKVMKSNTIFRIFSMSKIITSTAVMILFERGQIDLYTPVSRYLPGFKNQMVLEGDNLVPAKREVTVRDLLNMTSGLCYPGIDTKAEIEMDKVFKEKEEKLKRGIKTSTVEFCNNMGKVPLKFHPGEGWQYGTSADILGAIVEIISGKRFSKFLNDEIFKPLKMEDTGFYIEDSKKERLAKVYRYDEKNEVLELFQKNHLGIESYSKDTAFESGGAGLLSTIEDYAKFASMLLNKGKYRDVRILGRKTVELMTENGLNEKQLQDLNWEYLQGYGYGNLMRILINKSEASANASIGEFGWDGWLGTYVSIDPKENLVFLYFIQLCDTGTTEVARKLKSIVYSYIE